MNLLDNYREEIYPNESLCEEDYFLRIWRSNKQQLAQLLKAPDLRIRKPIAIEKDEEQLKSEVSRRLLNHPFILAFERLIADMRWGIKTPCTESEQELLSISNLTSHPESFINNNCKISYYTYPTSGITIMKPDGHKYTFNENSKLIRVLGTFAKAFNIPHFEEFRQLHSQILNEKIVKGNLVLSIHPLDFLRMSDPENGWTSCMRWSASDPGEYCRGTVSMLNSAKVLVAYLTHDEPEVIRPKMLWRELFIVDQSALVGIKGYPYWNRKLEVEVLEMLRELAHDNLGWDYESSVFWFDGDIGALIPNTEANPDIIVTCGDDNPMYCDIRYEHQIILADLEKDVNIDYGEVETCIICGTINGDYYENDRLACQNCDPVIYCECCEEPLSEEDAIQIHGEYYCSSCIDDIAFVCCECGQYELTDNMYSFMTPQGDYIDLCPDCYDKYFIDASAVSIGLVSLDQLTPAGEEEFSYLFE